MKRKTGIAVWLTACAALIAAGIHTSKEIFEAGKESGRREKLQEINGVIKEATEELQQMFEDWETKKENNEEEEEA